MRSIFNSHYLLWLCLAVPAIPLLPEVFVRERYYAEIMYDSGLWSVQFMVLALAITPLMHLTNGARPVRWLRTRRRAIGVASFAYAALHTGIYIRETSDFELIIYDMVEPDLLVGWIGFFALLLLALTSNNYSQRLLGKHWKTLQRGAYFAMALSLLHWWLIGQFFTKLALWSALVIGPQLIRLWLQSQSSRQRLSRREAPSAPQ